jgi:hypothetical protein
MSSFLSLAAALLLGIWLGQTALILLSYRADVQAEDAGRQR